MTNFKISGELLAASADDRTLTYRLLPFGEKSGRTLSGHQFTASKDSVTVPRDLSHLVVNTEHQQSQPVGRFTSVETRADGLYATLHISDFERGDAALLAARSGDMTGISVEVRSAVIKAGRLIAGELTGAALCKSPSIEGAVLMASDTPAVDGALDSLKSAIEALTTALQPDAPAEDISKIEDLETQIEDTADAEADAPTTEEEDDKLSNLKATNGAVSARKPELSAALVAKAYATRDVTLLAGLEDAGVVGEENLFAALTGTTGSAHTSTIEQSQWLGALWSGKNYTRKYAQLFNTGSLTSWKVEGWRFLTKPTVADYAGDLAEIHSSTVTTEAYSEEAERIAGGWKLDRKYRDFSNTEFINSFFAAASEDYARKTDIKVLTFLTNNAVAVSATPPPTGVASAANRIVKGAMSMIDFAMPSFALVGIKAYEDMLLTTEFDNLKFINQALGLEGGSTAGLTIIPSADIGPDDVYLGAKEAATVFELGGDPIRVSALDISHGGEDEAIFGYLALVLNDKRGIVKVS